MTGVRAIDSLLPFGKGQRIGIFGGSGVGKSTLLGALARHQLGRCHRHRADRRAQPRSARVSGKGPRRRRACGAAWWWSPPPTCPRPCASAPPSWPSPLPNISAICGKNVLLVTDSVTRLAMAQREIGLAAGEPPSQKGYTPSVFNLLPKIFERAGNFGAGSITGFFTVLVEGDDFNEPICDAVRAILDGHVVLSRELGAKGHYPAIDILNSVSRLAGRVASKDQREAARKVREALAAYRQSEDLINLGAYASGSNPQLDSAIKLQPQLSQFLRQEPEVNEPLEKTLQQFYALAGMSK